MNTGIRRFILRLSVGLLAFLIGVTAVWALGGFNPFHSSSGTKYYRHKRCGSYRSGTTTPEPAFMYPLFRQRGDGSRAWGLPGERTPQPPALAPEAGAPTVR
jgi:hypothetical protein